MSLAEEGDLSFQDVVAVARPRGRDRITVSSPMLVRRQRWHFALFNVGPLVLALAAIASGLAYGVTGLDLGLLVAGYFLSVAGVELGLHRGFSHAAFVARPGLRAALAVLGMTAAEGPVSYWAANHRRHHAFADTERDPHSPRRGFWHAHLLWVLDKDVTLIQRFAGDLVADPLLRRLDQAYYVWVALGIFLPGVIGGILGGSWSSAVSGLLWGGGLRLFLVQHGVFFINSGCHRFGRRDFRSGDLSTNIRILAGPSLGGSLHNNHHAAPAAYTTALLNGDVDPGAWILRALRRLGWITHLNPPSPDALEAQRTPGARALVNLNQSKIP